jgi:hypothetical protein
MNTTPITPKEANERGYVPITKEYKPIADKEIFEKALAQLEGTDYCVVQFSSGLVIGRLAIEVDLIQE